MCSDYDEMSRVALLAATDVVVFIIGDVHLGFHKRKIIFDLFYFPLIEPTKGILNMRNIRKDPIGGQSSCVNCKLIEDIYS